MKAPISPQMVFSEASRSDEALAPACDFSAIYRDHFAATVVWLRALGVPESELEDVAQETFVVVHRKLGQFVGGSLPAWLYRIAQRTASDHRRRAWFRRLFSRASETELAQIAHPTPSAASLYEAEEARSALHDLLAQLDEKLRVVFWLFEIEECSAKEIADLLAVTPSTVFMRLHHARQGLKKAIEKRQRKGQRR